MRPQRPSATVSRPVLRPGVHVLRRSAHELQVGLDPRHALVLPDRPDVRAALASLTSPGSTPGEGYDAGVLRLLAEADLLVDADCLLPLIPLRPGPHHSPATVSRSDVAALAAECGDGIRRGLRARTRARVEVMTCGSPEAAAVSPAVVEILTAAGLRESAAGPGSGPGSPPTTTTTARDDRRPGRVGSRPDDPVTGLLVAVGEPARDRLDRWMREGTPHLLLRLTEGRAIVGPFVRPGQTACLRCIDAHHTDVDPAWPLLVEQYASAVAREREDAVPEPVDTALAALAAAWAARELVSHAEGRTPATASTTIRLHPQLTALETQGWPRHPGCGCSWS